MPNKPLILAPAGNTDCFLAALAAGADAIYCGLKQFSARQAAINFTLPELAELSQLARKKGTAVYIPLNTIIKPDELDQVYQAIDQLNRYVKPDALIVQDLAIANLAAQIGFKGEIHLSTLANLSFPEGLKDLRKKYGISRVVIPRELSIDEIRQMAKACPKDLTLEVFVHGALCYAISGRCYWSSFLGGKSGLRGRCVQPCRRSYRQKGPSRRLFACQDLSIDVLAKVLTEIEQISTWKIEGRRKGPHYVFHTVSAYRLLRDEGKDPGAKKLALHLLEQALGRPGTHYYFLPQRPQMPVRTDIQTGSGKLVGKIQGPAKSPYFIPREEILAGDLLRIGYEDDLFHNTFKATKQIPKRGRLHLSIKTGQKPKSGAPIFLLDRRDKELKTHLNQWREELKKIQSVQIAPNKIPPPKPPHPPSRKRSTSKKILELKVYHKPEKGSATFGLWLPQDPQSAKLVPKRAASCWIWLAPAIWPDTEADVKNTLDHFIRLGVRHFVINAPWQYALFPKIKGMQIWAGPFCNISNPLAIKALANSGIHGVIVSPELGKADYTALGRNSRLPLGIVLSGMWPLCISRTACDTLTLDQQFVSPKGEAAWVKKRADNYWVYPNWRLDLSQQQNFFQKAGFQIFVHLEESLPRSIEMKKRPGIWNFNHGLQ